MKSWMLRRRELLPWLAAALGIVLVAALFHRFQMRELPARITLRVGMQESPPWYFLLSDNVIGGPVYEVVQEVARRRNLDLLWVTDSIGPDHALSTGVADVWPLMGILPSRKGRFDTTSSWIDLSYVLCTPVACGAVDTGPVKPRTIAHRGTEVTRSVLADRFPGVGQVPAASHAAALAAACSGAADAAVISETVNASAPANVPPECQARNVCLKSELIENVGFGVGSRPGSSEARAAAIVIRSEIDRMIDDGTLAGILIKWGVSSGEIRALRSARLASTRLRIMSGVAAGLVFALFILWFVYRRLLAAKRDSERVQDELRQSQQALRAEFERRRDLEERYHQAQKLESLGRLAGGVAHDFNNLLTVINGFSEMLLLDQSVGADTRQRLVEISKAGSRGAKLTRQLLMYSRNPEGEMSPLNLNQVVSDVSSLLQTMAGANVKIETRLASGLGLVRANRSQMDRLLMNLVVNARDAMPDGGSITIETANASNPGSTPGDFIVLTVADTGTGMDFATRNRIFEPFFTTKRPEIGTGMGLPIVQSVAHGAGGWIDVESAVGAGSKFRVVLPRALDLPLPQEN